MKKSLILLPLAISLLSGCLPAKKGGGSGATSANPSAGPAVSASETPSKSVEPVEGEFGTADNPITVSAFVALVEKYCTFPSTNKGYDTYKDHLVYVSGACTSNNTPTEYHEMGFVNLKQDSAEMLIMYGVFATEELEKAYKEKDSMKGKTVKASGYACFYNKNGQKVYELSKKDNDNKPQLLSIQ